MATATELGEDVMAGWDAEASAAAQSAGTNGANGANAGSHNANHLKQKRARSQLSCTPCRTGKLKCNREKPHCDQCIKRGREGQCIFVPPPAKNKPVHNVKGRIRQLEDLVVDLMNQNKSAAQKQAQQKQQQPTPQAADSADGSSVGPHSQPTPPSDSDTSPQFSAGTAQSGQSGGGDEPPPPSDELDAATPLFGSMRISKNEISYVGESHWGAILNSISELKRDLVDDDTDEVVQPGPENPLGRSDTNSTGGWSNGVGHQFGKENPGATSGLGFMLGNTAALSKDQLIASVPEKRIVDRLLSLWFNSPDPFKPIIHAPTFQEEYKRFWRSPKEAPIMWLGLLYAIMSLAASFGLRDIDPSTPQSQKVLSEVNEYHSLSASAAVLADFTKPKEHTLECLILYAAGLRSNNAFVNVWLMIGLIIRLALRMGYHRDARHYPNISPFQGEMRRRTWAIISMIDVLISFQLGLPSMVKTIQSDAQPPRNILDRDFNPETKVLPQSRGIGELTPSSYTRAKLRITRIFADASELSHATVPPAYEDMMKLDDQLEEAKAAIPPLLQMPGDGVTDSAEQLMCRFNLDLLYLKTKTVLHRRYMLTPFAQLSEEEQKVGIGRSRKTCIECARRVLQHHHTIYSASQPGGQLESVKWYMGSISTHDFLLAAMILCLDLSQQLNDGTFRASLGTGMECPRRRLMMVVLEKSQKIWADASRRKKSYAFTSSEQQMKGEHIFDETEKASRAMAVMIEKVKAQMSQEESRGTPAMRADDALRGARSPGSYTCANIEDMVDSVRPPQTRRTIPEGVKNPSKAAMPTYDWMGIADGPPAPPEGAFEFTGAPWAHNGALGSSAEALLTSGGTINVNYDPQSYGSSGATALSNPSASSNETSPDQQQAQEQLPDFSMIGDMLDINHTANNVDWESWDNEIFKGPQIHDMDWLVDLDLPANNYGVNPRAGNVLTGSGPIIPGNASIPGGTGAVVVPRGPSDVAFNQGSWDTGFTTANDILGNSSTEPVNGSSNMDFDMDVPLQDVNFDMMAKDYNAHGAWPVTKDDWAEFQRKRTGYTPAPTT